MRAGLHTVVTFGTECAGLSPSNQRFPQYLVDAGARTDDRSAPRVAVGGAQGRGRAILEGASGRLRLLPVFMLSQAGFAERSAREVDGVRCRCRRIRGQARSTRASRGRSQRTDPLERLRTRSNEREEHGHNLPSSKQDKVCSLIFTRAMYILDSDEQASSRSLPSQPRR